MFHVQIYSFQESYREEVKKLLVGLPNLYPGANPWLQNRLNDVVDGKAYCSVAKTLFDTIVGITINTPKTKYWKLSTIYVNPRYRKTGIGKLLIQDCVDQWKYHDVKENIVTVRLGREEPLLKLLAPFGFKKIDIQSNRYGEGQTEVILQRKI